MNAATDVYDVKKAYTRSYVLNSMALVPVEQKMTVFKVVQTFKVKENVTWARGRGVGCRYLFDMGTHFFLKFFFQCIPLPISEYLSDASGKMKSPGNVDNAIYLRKKTCRKEKTGKNCGKYQKTFCFNGT